MKFLKLANGKPVTLDDELFNRLQARILSWESWGPGVVFNEKIGAIRQLMAAIFGLGLADAKFLVEDVAQWRFGGNFAPDLVSVTHWEPNNTYIYWNKHNKQYYTRVVPGHAQRLPVSEHMVAWKIVGTPPLETVNLDKVLPQEEK